MWNDPRFLCISSELALIGSAGKLTFIADVAGRKKVRTFGMLKYLSEHMSSPNTTSKRH